jgi:hypothetical protein
MRVCEVFSQARNAWARDGRSVNAGQRSRAMKTDREPWRAEKIQDEREVVMVVRRVRGWGVVSCAARARAGYVR